MADPETRYARSGGVSIAYQVVGDGPFDLVLVPGFVSNVELGWKIPDRAAYLGRLASFSRLILFDKRGTGMSDRVTGAPSLETRMDDVRAVMDAAGSSRAAILGVSEGGPMSLLFAATYPERVSALVLYASFPRILWAPDYPIGEREEEYDRASREEEERWGSVEYVAEVSDHYSSASDDESRRASVEFFRQSASPGAIAALNEMNKHIDVRHVLSAIHVPTLVLNLTHDDPFNVASCRYMAERIPGAQLVEVPGRGHVPTLENFEPIVGAIDDFLRRARQSVAWDDLDHNRVLATLLFTDIVGSRRAPWSGAIAAGASCWRAITSSCAPSSCTTAARSSTPPATASSRGSTGRHARSAVPTGSSPASTSSESTSAPASTRVSASSSSARSAASPSASVRVLLRRLAQVRCSCRTP